MKDHIILSYIFLLIGIVFLLIGIHHVNFIAIVLGMVLMTPAFVISFIAIHERDKE